MTKKDPKQERTLFSYRMGIKKFRDQLQIDSMDDDLRNSLWNAFYKFFLPEPDSGYLNEDDFNLKLFSEIWENFLKKNIDEKSSYAPDINSVLKKYFFDSAYYDIFDLIEFTLNLPFVNPNLLNLFIEEATFVLERELSGYRIIGNNFTQITSESEIETIEEAFDRSKPYQNVYNHLQTAQSYLADRKKPDYRNSIKESISAIEAICREIMSDSNGTLGQILKRLETEKGLHPALKNAFSNLYGYTSSADGIRHALMDTPNLSFEDAKFMFVACSAFANYLIMKLV